MHHHKFVPEHEDNVDKNLMEMKSGNPNEVFYNVCWFWNEGDPNGPGKFSLRFISDKKPDAHTIVISPQGFVWGTKRYQSLECLLRDFEQDPRDSPSTNWKSEDVWSEDVFYHFKEVSVSGLGTIHFLSLSNRV